MQLSIQSTAALVGSQSKMKRRITEPLLLYLYYILSVHRDAYCFLKSTITKTARLTEELV